MDGNRTHIVQHVFCRNGLSSYSGSGKGNVLRVQPPLNIEPELINRAFDILEASVTDYENGAIGDDVLRYKAGW